ncbi:MAG: type IIL restriction-modification enzyme MmeI, partial [Geminicoccaceae bacterium]
MVGNPPFIGASRLRESLGDGYAEALWAAYPKMPQSADLVMFWWEKAALCARRYHAKTGKGTRRFGLITTKSIHQTFNRRVMEPHLADPKKPLSLTFAIPNHPWVDALLGAAVRIGMTVGTAGRRKDRLYKVAEEGKRKSEEEGREVIFEESAGKILANLRIGPDVSSVVSLKANAGISSPGVKLHGSGFIVSPEQAERLGLGSMPGVETYIRQYRNGRDLTSKPRGVMVIDLYPLAQEEVRAQFPLLYQHVYDHVRPERLQNREPFRRNNWHWFGRTHETYRSFTKGLGRFIVTVETMKHRVFQFLSGETRADNMLVSIGSADAANLATLSSRFHVTWALAAGGRLGVGNDPRYNKSRCFDPFP